MAFIRRLFTSERSNSRNKDGGFSSLEQQEVIFEDDQDSERPYQMNSIYYLAIILFIGVPMWMTTCSSTRYSLPNLTQLESKLAAPGPFLHLDISVVQLSSSPGSRDISKEDQLNLLRNDLPSQLVTSFEGLVYNLNWRIRRPTQEESQGIKLLLKEQDKPPTTNEQRQVIYSKLEEHLLKIHKASNRFRLFMYIVEGPLTKLICSRPHSYLVNFERFVYICPSQNDASTANLIRSALEETYQDTIDPKRIKKILGAKTDLLVSLIPESETTNLSSLSQIADKVHSVHDKNVKSKYLELAGILNIRLITQNIYLIQDDFLDKMLLKSPTSSGTQSNSTLSDQDKQVRVLNTHEMGRFFHEYESRLNKHSSTSVHHIVTLVPDASKPKIVVDQSGESPVNILEERDTNFILLGSDDKSLVLGLRAVVRRVIGLKSVNLCPNCIVKREVFMNKWELDAIVGALTISKLQSVHVSLKSISQQAIGVKIPKYVSKMVFEAHSLALESIDNLETKKPLEAYYSVSPAHELSETAFFDPSLLETLYFPDESKYAIYLPLFLPLAFPLLLSILRVSRYLLSPYLPESFTTKTEKFKNKMN